MVSRSNSCALSYKSVLPCILHVSLLDRIFMTLSLDPTSTNQKKRNDLKLSTTYQPRHGIEGNPDRQWSESLVNMISLKQEYQRK